MLSFCAVAADEAVARFTLPSGIVVRIVEASFDMSTLMRLSEFLRKFVAGLEPRETIQWK